ncbi:TIGR03086 family metal-binding protein [Actinacidiphila oryziradicis]|uniref:TIGR03086 family metal-binding protein n=1 Tax=Actinacidiphila oryziradicis TaxID=2571141 RepID=UPI0023F0A8C0|nr:TIGR03086 family metal-binding protein [Actinacidiphila oryziradicis]MCW2872328.1 hypothetical protein [Actinacidiphila oryziradicis]
MTDIRVLDRRALAAAEEIVRKIDGSRPDRPTPCSEWTLAQLLAHMVGQNHGFAAAARGAGKDLAVWADRPVGEEPAEAFAASAAKVTAAFGEEGALERGFCLPEIRDGGLFPARTAIGFHFVDTVVHGWDVARSIGVEAAFDADLLAAVLPIAEAVPGGAARQRKGSAFRHGVPAGEGAGLLDRILALLGRDPGWTAS